MAATVDASTAVAALQSAGNDARALETAIRQAAFLMATPGDKRQKLRAAKTTLRKLRAEAAELAKSGTSDPASKPSPHAKASYSPSEFDELSEKYEKLNWRMISKPGGATVKPAPFYQLYGLCTQVIKGDNDTERPMWAERGGLDFEGRERWDAWEALKGEQASEAKIRFVKMYYEFSPSCLYKDTR
ncbi:unnamed protein product [Ostreobium quekettii]|uniref:ACB domain-containing protein n=1 Tax=Ostreobium quekettii TaxID=121088 RepID=A0A8S1IQD1_9CHLO|nr:unnamed protein product [Ostreobium quekettii]